MYSCVCATNYADHARIGCPRLRNGAQFTEAATMVHPLDSFTPTPNPAELVQQVADEVQNFKPSSEQTWATASSSISAAAALADGGDDGRHAIQVEARAKQASDDIDSTQAIERDLTAKFSTLANLRANGQIDSGTESKIAQLAKDFGSKVTSEYAALDKVRYGLHDGSHPSQADTMDQLSSTQIPLTQSADTAWHAAAPRDFMKETHDQFETTLTNLIGNGYDKHGAINRDVGQMLFTAAGDGESPNPDPIAVQQFKQDASALDQLKKELSDQIDAATDLGGLQPGPALDHANRENMWAQGELQMINDEVTKVDDAISKVSPGFGPESLPRLASA